MTGSAYCTCQGAVWRAYCSGSGLTVLQRSHQLVQPPNSGHQRKVSSSVYTLGPSPCRLAISER